MIGISDHDDEIRHSNESALESLTRCENLIEQEGKISGFSEDTLHILQSTTNDSFYQESFLVDVLQLLNSDSTQSSIDAVAESLVSKFDQHALLNASFMSIKELGSGQSNAAFKDAVTTLQVASTVVRLLLSSKNKRLWDITHNAAEEDGLFSLLLSLPGFVSRAYRRQKVAAMLDFFLPEAFHVHLIYVTVDYEVFPSVVRLILRRNRGRAIAHGLWSLRHRLETHSTQLLGRMLTGREEAEFIRCVLEFEVQNPSCAGFSRALCSPLIGTSLDECCNLLILSTSLPQSTTTGYALVHLFAELLKDSSFTFQTDDLCDDMSDAQDELSKIATNDRMLWMALMKVSSVWASIVYVRQSDHACQTLASGFILRALELLGTRPIPMTSIVPMNLLNGVTARLSATNQSIRLDGMRIGERLGKSLGEEVHFEELHEKDAVSAPQELQAEDKALNEYVRDDDDSSDGSVHLQTFDLSDDQEDLLQVQLPLYLSECLDCFRSSESDENGLLKIEVALKSVSELVRSAPADLQDFGPEIARSVLRLENKSNLDNFEELSAEALCSLVVMDPLAVGTNLIEEVFQDCSLGDRLAALTALRDAAIELSGGLANETLLLTFSGYVLVGAASVQLFNHCGPLQERGPANCFTLLQKCEKQK
jgi:Telomere length regulation protein